jgi:hypothetical protein
MEVSWVHASNLLGQNIVEKIGIAEAALKSTPIPHTEYYLFDPCYSQIFLIVRFQHMHESHERTFCPVKRLSLPADFSRAWQACEHFSVGEKRFT